MEKRTFHSSLWNHYCVYKNVIGLRGLTPEESKRFSTNYSKEIKVPVVEKHIEEHSGLKEECLKCEREGTMGDFTNHPTFRGHLVALGTLIFIISLVACIMIYIK